MSTPEEEQSRLRRSNSFKERSYQDCEKDLPPEILRASEYAFNAWCDNPSHRSLELKKIEGRPGMFEVRVTLAYRAIFLIGEEDGVKKYFWKWIGNRKNLFRVIPNLK